MMMMMIEGWWMMMKIEGWWRRRWWMIVDGWTDEDDDWGMMKKMMDYDDGDWGMMDGWWWRWGMIMDGQMKMMIERWWRWWMMVKMMVDVLCSLNFSDVSAGAGVLQWEWSPGSCGVNVSMRKRERVADLKRGSDTDWVCSWSMSEFTVWLCTRSAATDLLHNVFCHRFIVRKKIVLSKYKKYTVIWISCY